MKKLYSIILILLFFSYSTLQAQNYTEMKAPINKKNVIESTPSISLDGRILIFVSDFDGTEKLYQSYLKNDGTWELPTSIDSINMLAQKDDKMGSSSLSFDGNTLYFCATFSGGEGGMDIYYSERNGRTWSKPKNIGKSINTELYDGTPSISSDNNYLYFARSNPGYKTKGYACKKIYVSERDSSGKWKEPIPLPPPINIDCEQSPRICSDNRTLFFSSVREGCKGHADLFMVKILAKNIWSDVLPLDFANTKEGDQYASITASGERMYYSISGIDDNTEERFGGIYYIDIPQEFQPYHSATISGVVKDSITGKPIEATFYIRDANTSKLIYSIKSNKGDGNYILVLNEGKNYTIEVQKKDYSHYFMNFKLKKMTKNIEKKQNISLFSKVKLQINVFDKDNFRPIDASIEIKNTKNDTYNKVVTENKTIGRYQILLDISKKYSIKIKAPNYKPYLFDFDLSQILQFGNFSQNIDLEPVKEEIEINIFNQKNQPIDTKLQLTNIETGEIIFIKPKINKEGKKVIYIKKGNKYDMNITKKGYSFYNTSLDLTDTKSKKKTKVEAKLTELVENAKLTLKNITFESNSAEIRESSHDELDRVIKLMNDNPKIRIEISAHTDNVGSNAYNLKLSDRRAKSVVQYLTDKDIDINRMVYKGYGESQPIAANDTDENKALNRRVELKIIK